MITRPIHDEHVQNVHYDHFLAALLWTVWVYLWSVCVHQTLSNDWWWNTLTINLFLPTEMSLNMKHQSLFMCVLCVK